jgi:hypothetical protein
MSPAVKKILAEIDTLSAAEQQELRGLLVTNQASSPRPVAQLVNEIKGKQIPS